MDRFFSIYKETIGLFHSSMANYMPPGPYNDFQRWALSPANDQHVRWHQIIGIPQFAKLTETLLGDIVPEERKWTYLLPYASWMNTYLIYETISDNLAIGLAEQQAGDTTFHQRKRILLNFNAAMVARLKGDNAHSQMLLDEIKADAQRISSFEQSLTMQEQTSMAMHYLAKNHLNDMKGIEFDTWSPLVGNIESAACVADMLDANILGPYFRDGLIWRYEAVSKLMNNDRFTLEELKGISTHSILVIPVLVYYISVLSEILYPNPAIQTVLESQILKEALEDAALMVRLTNDLGTNLTVSQDYITLLFNELYNKCQTEFTDISFRDFLLSIASTDVNMTRIQKDIAYGEYNVSLHGLMDVPLSPQNLLVFATNVVYFNQCYQQCRSRLSENLATIEDMLRDDKVSRLIQRFVDFHEHIYSSRFDDQSGDYATKPD